jgi:hypothetical protein
VTSNSQIPVGRLSAQERASGGAWLVGDRFPENHPGRSHSVFYKSWIAQPSKYGPRKYTARSRSTEGIWEYVQVFRGRLECIVTTNEINRRGSLARLQSIDLPPSVLRAWELPTSQLAAGITLLRPTSGLMHVDGAHGFEFHAWTGGTLPLVLTPFSGVNWRTCLIEVLLGNVQIACGRWRRRTIRLGAGEHAFLPTDVSLRIKKVSQLAAGTCLYLV